MLAIWQGLISFGYAPVTLLPPPGQVFMRLARQLANTEYQQDIAATLNRMALETLFDMAQARRLGNDGMKGVEVWTRGEKPISCKLTVSIVSK